MTLQEIFDYLALGQLGNTGDVENGAIKASSYQRIANLVQLALTDLHTRFPLKDSELLLDQDDGTIIYYLKSEHAYSNTESTAQKYINDTTNPFTDDIIAITAMYDEAGCLVPLNDYTDGRSIYTTGPTTLQITQPVTGNTTFIMYRANHPKLGDVSDPSAVNIELPQAALDAVLGYVTYRAYQNKQNPESQAISQQSKMYYEEQCLFLQKYIAVNNISGDRNTSFENNGWV